MCSEQIYSQIHIFVYMYMRRSPTIGFHNFRKHSSILDSVNVMPTFIEKIVILVLQEWLFFCLLRLKNSEGQTFYNNSSCRSFSLLHQQINEWNISFVFALFVYFFYITWLNFYTVAHGFETIFVVNYYGINLCIYLLCRVSRSLRK